MFTSCSPSRRESDQCHSPRKITSFSSLTTTPKDVSTRSRLKTAIESSLAHLDLKMLNKGLDLKCLRVVGSKWRLVIRLFVPTFYVQQIRLIKPRSVKMR
jgi:hypothetical protein